MIKGFKDFLMRGNVVDLAVAVVIGTAFAKVVDAFVKVIMDLIGKLGGTPNFSGCKPGGVAVGAFLTALISFVIVAAAVYFMVVVPDEPPRRAAQGGRRAGARGPLGGDHPAAPRSATPPRPLTAPRRARSLALDGHVVARAPAVRVPTRSQSRAQWAPPSRLRSAVDAG